MTKQEFEYHLRIIIHDSAMIERYQNDIEIVRVHLESLNFHKKSLKELYDRNEETE